MASKPNDALHKWLAEQGRSTSHAMAARSALRAIPLLGGMRQSGLKWEPSKESWEYLVLQLFRTNLIVWATSLDSNLLHANSAAAQAARNQLLSALSAGPTNHDRQAVFAASDAVLCATAAEDAVAAVQALQTVAPSSFASKSRLAGLADDQTLISGGMEPGALAQHQLWASPPSRALEEGWEQLATRLADLGHDWGIWIEWYADRVHGRPMPRALLNAWLSIPIELWNAGAGPVNARLKQLVPDQLPSEPQIDEPETEPGPEFLITSQGLSLKASDPPQGSFDIRTQQHLYVRLKRTAALLAEASYAVGNAHPGLEMITSEYAELISEPFDELDVTSLWAVGTGLLANRDAFARAQDTRTMTEPLEPAHFALLQHAAELHGGFILGFPEARELTERADRARLSGEAMERVVSIARALLEEIRNSGRQVEAKTRKFLGAIEEGLVEPGWKITRAGYAAYVVTRNALIAIGRLLGWTNSAFSTVVGGIALSQIDPGLAQTQFWIEFVIKNASQILAFSDPFPELKIWLAAQIEAARQDRQGRS